MSCNSDSMTIPILAKCRSIFQQFNALPTIIPRCPERSRAGSRNVQQRHSNIIRRLLRPGRSSCRDREEERIVIRRSPPLIVSGTIHVVKHLLEISFRAFQIHVLGTPLWVLLSGICNGIDDSARYFSLHVTSIETFIWATGVPNREAEVCRARCYRFTGINRPRP